MCQPTMTLLHRHLPTVAAVEAKSTQHLHNATALEKHRNRLQTTAAYNATEATLPLNN